MGVGTGGVGGLEAARPLPVLWRRPPEPQSVARVIVMPARRLPSAPPPPAPGSAHRAGCSTDRLRAVYGLDQLPAPLVDLLA